MSVANIVATSLCDVNRPQAGGYSSFKVHATLLNQEEKVYFERRYKITGAWHKHLYNYRLSSDGPALVFFSPPMPIFFRNGSIDCLRARNFSIDSVTSRESPCS